MTAVEIALVNDSGSRFQCWEISTAPGNCAIGRLQPLPLLAAVHAVQAVDSISLKRCKAFSALLRNRSQSIGSLKRRQMLPKIGHLFCLLTVVLLVLDLMRPASVVGIGSIPTLTGVIAILRSLLRPSVAAEPQISWYLATCTTASEEARVNG